MNKKSGCSGDMQPKLTDMLQKKQEEEGNIVQGVKLKTSEVNDVAILLPPMVKTEDGGKLGLLPSLFN
jgi:hypothetical protein